ncbi:HAD-superfamily subfamily IIA hydrolase, TIGR01458 [Halomicrobium zhouii]|uniref:HAD-superfamily subfamily IIA hydrolase, TIGR01458 n=1 Tax=Halomicrobium zhouii TaxID=767519 RepID=A0A1I6L5C7_9EURY|nr:HAD-IIA family hydrolase [Halomicrobium zhouii]SFR98681.1 HAD-superfamily subfamily IIA hydrolase, TIGR01458 [Halomicrobium zhouii]
MLVDQYDAFLVDMDGVVHVGDSPVPGAVDAIQELRERGKSVRFVTNNSRARRETLVEDLQGFGIEADPEDVVSAAWATAEYLAEQGIESVSLVGGEGFAEMIRAHGIAVRDEAVDAVVVGHDDTVAYADIKQATQLIYEEGASLVAANADGWYPTSDGIAPGTGATVAAIEAATGAAATVVGKPEPRLFEIAMEGLSPERTVMVGDNPQADLVGAEAAGIDAVLVTGTGGDVDAGDLDGVEVSPVTTVESLATLFT